MKILKKVVLTGALTTIALMTLTITAKAATVKVTGEVVNIRKSASTSSDVVAMLSEGIECEYLGEEGDWYKVKYKRYTGYITKQYAKIIEESKTTENTNTETTQTTEENNTKNEESTTQEVNSTTENTQSTETKTQEPKTIQYQKLTKDSSVKILPLIQSSNIGNLKKDAEVLLIAKTGSWAYIQANEFNGWVRLDSLTDGKTVTTGENNETTAQEKTGYISENYVNVRKGAGTNYSIVKVLTLNSTVTVIGEEGDWYQIKSGSDTGYVSKQFVSESKKTTSRSLETSRTTNEEENKNKVTETEKSTEEKVETSSKSSQNTTVIQETKTTISNTKSEETKTTDKTESTSKNETASSKTSTKSETTNSETKSQTTKSETTTKAETTTTTKGEEVVAYAKKFLGARYVYGGDGSNGTFDCSGFTMYVYRHFGISLPHGATSQSRVSNGTKITKQSDLKAGDIVFLLDYETGVGIGHCGIYIGDGKFIHASTTGYKVIISSLNTIYEGRFYSGMRFF